VHRETRQSFIKIAVVEVATILLSLFSRARVPRGIRSPLDGLIVVVRSRVILIENGVL
jgi:hypothetical protein